MIRLQTAFHKLCGQSIDQFMNHLYIKIDEFQTVSIRQHPLYNTSIWKIVNYFQCRFDRHSINLNFFHEYF